jgi:hypothetical protein
MVPEVLRRVSAGTGAVAVAVFQDIGKDHQELAHAVDGEIITAVTVPGAIACCQRT